jgi:D-3-phosphoglycerate dehydrogenase / 2-oxoglutarate reductase
MPKVLITAGLLRDLNGRFAEELRSAGFELACPVTPGQQTEEEILRELPGIDACLAGSEPYTRGVLQANRQLRVIARCGVGYDAVDLAAATEFGVVVTIAPGTNHDAVAEHTFALILALAKRIPAQHAAMQAGQWPRQATLPLRGCTLGVAGLGRIGKAVALRGECFGMRLLATETVPDMAFVAKHGITLMPFEQLLAESDYLSLHVPFLAESKHLINRRALSLMKPTAFLINTARGGLVCEADLIEALRGKRLGGAGLDVFEDEPVSRTSPLLSFDNVVLTPHAAGTDLRSRDDMALSAAQAIVGLSRGEWPAEQIVNPDVRGRFRWDEGK